MFKRRTQTYNKMLKETSLWQHYTTQANNVVVYGHEAYKSKYDNNSNSNILRHTQTES